MRSVDKPAASKVTGKIRKKVKSSTHASLEEIARILDKGLKNICTVMCELGEKRISAMKELEQIRREEEGKRQQAYLAFQVEMIRILTSSQK